MSARLTSGSAWSSDCEPPERAGAPGRPGADAGDAAAALAGDVLVGDELGAVLLHHLAGEGAAADDEHLLVVLLQFLDQGDEVAVAADDDEGVDVIVGERHLERVECEVDIGAVLVAAGGHHALHEADRMLRHGAAVIAGALPVAVGDFGDDFAAFFDGFEHGADIELPAEGGFDADFDVVEIDKYCNFQSLIGHVECVGLVWVRGDGAALSREVRVFSRRTLIGHARALESSAGGSSCARSSRGLDA